MINFLHRRPEAVVSLRRTSHALDLSYSKLLRWLWISAFFWLLLLCGVTAARAQTPPSLVFTASTTAANGKLDTTLTWTTVPVAGSCVAAGTPATWTGAKPPSGSFIVPTITKSGTYTPTLACQWPSVSTLELDWLAPTQNIDGTALTNLASYNIYWGAGNNPANWTAKVSAVAKTASFWVSGALAPGQWCGVVTTVNSNGAESDNSNIACKTISAVQNDTESVTLTVNPIPMAPGNVTAK